MEIMVKTEEVAKMEQMARTQRQAVRVETVGSGGDGGEAGQWLLQGNLTLDISLQRIGGCGGAGGLPGIGGSGARVVKVDLEEREVLEVLVVTLVREGDAKSRISNIKQHIIGTPMER